MRLAIALLLAATCYAQSVWTHGNSSTATPASATTSTTIAVTAGDVIVAFATAQSAYHTLVADDVNGAYTELHYYADDRTPNPISIWGVIATTSATVTVTAHPSTGGGEVHLHVANFTRTGTLSLTPNATGGATSAATVNLTTTDANTLLLGFADRSTSIAAGSGYTQIGTSTGFCRLLSEYSVTDNSAGSHTVNVDGGTAHGIVAVAMTGSGGGGSAGVSMIGGTATVGGTGTVK
jgi:hypothetical protein